VDGDRPAPPLVVVVLALCAIAGFVFGGVLASLPSSGGGSADPDATSTSSDSIAIDMTGVAVEASCQRESGRDEAGEQVEYLPALVFDDDSQTAWQCRGDGAGETLTFTFDEPVAITRLGLIPGYAKEDPTAGTEWYPRNRRLTEVLWQFDEGDPVSQTLDPDPDRRDLQYLDLDEPRTTSTLTMEIVSSELGDGDRPNIAVTELVIMRPDT
jgi:hypothetical protein